MLTKSHRIETVLAKQFPGSARYRTHHQELLVQYLDSGLAPPNLITELETGDIGKLWSHMWEAMLYRHLIGLGYAVRNCCGPGGQDGPDFCFDAGGRTIWVEAVVPSPTGIHDDYLALPKLHEVLSGTKPDQPRVLRCTSVIADKKAKFQDYRKKGIVVADDCAIIAVNICRLSALPDANGISQFPLAMEAAYPVGQIALPINPDYTTGAPENLPRFKLTKQNGSTIDSGYFVDPLYAGIAAVLQGHQRDMLDVLDLSLIHNVRATVPLPFGLFGAYKEFVGKIKGDYCYVKDVAPK